MEHRVWKMAGLVQSFCPFAWTTTLVLYVVGPPPIRSWRSTLEKVKCNSQFSYCLGKDRTDHPCV